MHESDPVGERQASFHLHMQSQGSQLNISSNRYQAVGEPIAYKKVLLCHQDLSGRLCCTHCDFNFTPISVAAQYR